MKSILKSLNSSKAWVFQGIGVTVITGLTSCVIWLFTNYRVTSINNNTPTQHTSPNTPVPESKTTNPSPEASTPSRSQITSGNDRSTVVTVGGDAGSITINQSPTPKGAEEDIKVPYNYALPSFVRSEVGADYRKLGFLLESQDFRRADTETYKIIEQVSGAKPDSGVSHSQMDDIPCSDIFSIDRLWTHYTNNRFGFSIQSEIADSILKTLREPTFYSQTYSYHNDSQITKEFASRVYWKKNSRWLTQDEMYLPINGVNGHHPRVFDFDEFNHYNMRLIEKFNKCSFDK